MTHRAVVAHLLFGVITVLSVTACKNPMTPDAPVATGMWGGPQAALTVTSSGAHVEMPCASGDILQTLLANSQGEFSADGTLAREVGPAHLETPAKFTGRVTNQTMTLTIAATGSTMGPFTLSFGSQPSFGKCV